jgi:hypothetical protein
MPLAKSAPSNEPISLETPSRVTDTPSTGNLGMGQVPFETYRFFGVNPGTIGETDIKQIKDVYDWANKDSKDMGETFLKIRQLENKMGQPSIGETRYSKMWNYVRVSKVYSGIKGDRENEIRKVREAREAEIKKIQTSKDKKISELERKKNLEIQRIKDSRSAELSKIKKLQQAYS